MKIKHYKQWKTTSLGMIIILSSIASVFIKEVQWADASIGIAVGLMLVFSPDTIIDKIISLLKLLVICTIVSCATEKKLAKKCADKFPIRDSTIIIEKIDTSYLYIDGDTIRVPFYLDGKVIYKDTICPVVKCPQVKVSKEKIVYQENTAKVRLCQIELSESHNKYNKLYTRHEELQKDYKDLKKQRNFIVGCILIFVCILFIISLLKKWI